MPTDVMERIWTMQNHFEVDCGRHRVNVDPSAGNVMLSVQ